MTMNRERGWLLFGIIVAAFVVWMFWTGWQNENWCQAHPYAEGLSQSDFQRWNDTCGP
jgi:hypothetical protein